MRKYRDDTDEFIKHIEAVAEKRGFTADDMTFIPKIIKLYSKYLVFAAIAYGKCAISDVKLTVNKNYRNYLIFYAEKTKYKPPRYRRAQIWTTQAIEHVFNFTFDYECVRKGVLFYLADDLKKQVNKFLRNNDLYLKYI